MANINSLTSSTSSANSLYGTRNVLSGLASGMDTEAMIENSVSGYKTKIAQFEKEQTTYQWKQDAYRSITDKMYDLEQKYTSYTSKTNLYSPSYFNNTVSTTPVSASAEAAASVSAAGRSSSDIQLLAAKAATAASYSVSASALGLNGANTATSGMTLAGSNITVGTLKGSMTLTYEGQKIDIDFDESDLIGDGTNGTKTLADAIRDKLDKATVSTSLGTKKASEVISVGTNNGAITFTDIGGRGANPYISSIGNSLKSALSVTESNLYEGSSSKKYTIGGANASFTTPKSIAAYLSERDINVTVDGVTKSFRLKESDITSNGIAGAFQTALDDIGANITVTETNGELKFAAINPSSNFSISTKDSKANELFGFGDGISNFLSDKSSIGTLLGSNFRFTPDNAAQETDTEILGRLNNMNSGNGAVVTDTTTGNRYRVSVDATTSGKTFYRVNEKGDSLYELKINDKSIYVSKDASLESVLEGINNSDMGVKAAYSKLTGKFTFTAKETGADGNISFDSNLASSLFKTKNNAVKLGDVLDHDWFEADGTIKLYTQSAANPAWSPKMANVRITKDTTISEFLTAYNKAVGSAQFYDSSNPADGHNTNTPLTGYDLTFRPSSASADINKYTLSNSNTGEKSITLTELVDRVNNLSRFQEGTDATVRALVNGEAVTLQRASNTIEMDGMSVTLKGDIGDVSAYKTYLDSDTSAAAVEARKAADTANNANAVSFKTTGGSDDLVKTIQSFVDDYNALLKEIHEAYTTQPAEKSAKNHTRYEPLSDDDKEGMSDKAIENYEAKAKQGLLFGDSDLRAAYESLVRVISPGGNDGVALRDMGIETTYSGGLTQIKLNESKLREKLDTDPDSVRNAFTKSKEGGAATDGLMTSIKNTMERYGSSSYSTPGILVKKAGSTHNATSLLNNDLQKQLDNIQTKIEQWQTKMSTKIDYYTRQFTALEKLMNTMNSQSSALAGLMGM